MRFLTWHGWYVALSAGWLFTVGVGGALAQALRIPETATALEGRPTVKVNTEETGSTRQTLTPTDASTQALKVDIQRGKYTWTSRGNQPLTLSNVGDYTYLMSNVPGQYVRLRRVNDRITYVEHLDMPAGHVTYWGEVRIVVGK